MTISTTLPVISSCDGCGACCTTQAMPPFLPDFFGEDMRNDEFDEFKRGWPALAVGLKAEYERKAREHDWPDSAPCFWYDAENRRCRNYEARPEICRSFEMAGEDCRRIRMAAKIDEEPRP